MQITQSTSTLNDRPKGFRLQNTLTSSTDSSIHGGHDASDLEMDYYDYNVHNTNSVPGSYIGMDPAYCLWIPPLSEGDPSPGNQPAESVEVSVLDKNDKYRKNYEISYRCGGVNRLSADSESTLTGDDCASVKTLKASPKAACGRPEKQEAECADESDIRFVDEDDVIELKDVSADVRDNRNREAAYAS